MPCDIFGPDLVLPSSPEPDTWVGGLFAVGSGITGLSPVGAEKYFAAATNVAKQIVVFRLFERSTSPAPRARVASPACIEEIVQSIGSRLWRGPVSEADRILAVELAAEAQKELDSPPGVETALTFLLTSPHFLYLPNDGGAEEQALGPGVGRPARSVLVG